MKVMVCIRYSELSGGSGLLTNLMDLAVEPLVGDELELLPVRGGPGQERHVSAWHERVVDRFVHWSVPEYALEVHVSPPHMQGSYIGKHVTADGRAKCLAEVLGVVMELRAAGWS